MRIAEAKSEEKERREQEEQILHERTRQEEYKKFLLKAPREKTAKYLFDAAKCGQRFDRNVPQNAVDFLAKYSASWGTLFGRLAMEFLPGNCHTTNDLCAEAACEYNRLGSNGQLCRCGSPWIYDHKAESWKRRIEEWCLEIWFLQSYGADADLVALAREFSSLSEYTYKHNQTGTTLKLTEPTDAEVNYLRAKCIQYRIGRKCFLSDIGSLIRQEISCKEGCSFNNTPEPVKNRSQDVRFGDKVWCSVCSDRDGWQATGDTVMLSCRECNWDMCMKCIESDDKHGEIWCKLYGLPYPYYNKPGRRRLTSEEVIARRRLAAPRDYRVLEELLRLN